MPRALAASLSSEGQPGPDYVKELVAGALAERIICAFSSRRPTGSENPFVDAPNSYMEAPSNAFAELYSATRLTRDRGYRGADDSDPMSGDLYLKGALPKRLSTSLNGRTISAVMTPICDLMSRNGKEPAATSVLLLEGTLQPTYHNHKLDPQMISFNGRFLRCGGEVSEGICSAPSMQYREVVLPAPRRSAAQCGAGGGRPSQGRGSPPPRRRGGHRRC